jgi:hypothetical protein
MTKKQAAIDWLRKHPGASVREANEAGITKSTLYLARVILSGKAPPSMRDKVPPAPPSPLSTSLTKLTEILKDLQGEGVTYLHFEGGQVEIRTTLYHKWEI